MLQEIYLIDNETDRIRTLKKMFKEDKDFKFKSYQENELSKVLKSIPSLIIINEDTLKEDACNMCKKIREDEDNGITPIIVISSKHEYTHKLEILKLGVSHYIRNPINEDYMYYTIKNILNLLYINRRVSPLTRFTRKCTNPSRDEKEVIKSRRLCHVIF